MLLKPPVIGQIDISQLFLLIVVDYYKQHTSALRLSCVTSVLLSNCNHDVTHLCYYLTVTMMSHIYVTI